jgi:hypothetical protein
MEMSPIDQAASSPWAGTLSRDQSPTLSQADLSGNFIAELLENLTHHYAKDPISISTPQPATPHSSPPESPHISNYSPHLDSPTIEAMIADTAGIDTPTSNSDVDDDSDAAAASSVKRTVDTGTGESPRLQRVQKKRKFK